MTGEQPKAFGLGLMKVEEEFEIDGKKYRFDGNSDDKMFVTANSN